MFTDQELNLYRAFGGAGGNGPGIPGGLLGHMSLTVAPLGRVRAFVKHCRATGLLARLPDTSGASSCG